MNVLPVTVSASVIEDGSTEPPRVGQEVAWTLELIDPAHWLGPTSEVSLAAEATPYARGPLPRPDEWPTRLRNGQLDCYWMAPGEERGRVRATGLLLHRLSGGMVMPDVGLTVGVVRRICVTRSPIIQDDLGTWRPLASGGTTHDVEQSPRWFATEHWDRGRQVHVRDTGLLVDLDVAMDFL